MDFPFPPIRDDLPPDAEPEPDWKIYENSIAHIEESYENCKVTRNHKVEGRRSGVQRQVDVWLEAELGDNHTVTVAIECRRYDRPVSIKDIDAFCGFLEDVGANKGVMISHSGYTDGAQERAKGAGIELRMLTVEEAEHFDWDEFVQDSCQGLQDCFGTIRWDFSDGDSEAGHCGNCGTFHIRCGKCGSLDWYNEYDMETCLSCGMKWRLLKEKNEVCDIEEIPPEEEEDRRTEARMTTNDRRMIRRTAKLVNAPDSKSGGQKAAIEGPSPVNFSKSFSLTLTWSWLRPKIFANPAHDWPDHLALPRHREARWRGDGRGL